MNWFRKLFNRKEVVVVDCAFNCLKDKCPKWVVLGQRINLSDGTEQDKMEGKCAVAWIPQLLVEIRMGLQEKKKKNEAK